NSSSNTLKRWSWSMKSHRLFLGLKDRGHRGPVLGQLRKRGGLVGGNGSFVADREVNPTLATRAATREPGIVPPGPDQGIMDGLAVSLQPEINGLHLLVTTVMGATCRTIDY